MIDLFHYWSTLTLVSFPMLLILGILSVHFLRTVLFSASRNRFKLEVHWDFLKVENALGDWIIPITIIAAIEFIVLVIMVCVSDFTTVELVHKTAMLLYPTVGWVSSAVLLVVGFWFLLRKIFDAYYLIAEKLSKL